jgi:hypothetical protein
MIVSCSVLLRMRSVSGRSCRENQNTHFMLNNVFLKAYHLCNNVENYGRARQATDDNIMWSMRFACRITKATNTHSEYVVPIAFQWQQWSCEHALVLTLCVQCLSSLLLVTVTDFYFSYVKQLSLICIMNIAHMYPNKMYRCLMLVIKILWRCVENCMNLWKIMWRSHGGDYEDYDFVSFEVVLYRVFRDPQ